MSFLKWYSAIVVSFWFALLLTLSFLSWAVCIVAMSLWAPVVFYSWKLIARRFPERTSMSTSKRLLSQQPSRQTLVFGAVVIALLAFCFYREYSLEENRPGLRMVEGQSTDKTRTDLFSGIVGMPVDVLETISSYTHGSEYGVGGSNVWFEGTWRRGNAVYRVGYLMGIVILAVGAGPIGLFLAYLKRLFF